MATILVVEDDASCRDLLVRTLQRGGHESVPAANGWEALLALDAAEIDLILLDLMMPGMDGRAFRERQRSAPELAAIPVVMMSAAHALMAAQAALQPSATLAKPFGLDELAAAVRSCARARAA